MKYICFFVMNRILDHNFLYFLKLIPNYPMIQYHRKKRDSVPQSALGSQNENENKYVIALFVRFNCHTCVNCDQHTFTEYVFARTIILFLHYHSFTHPFDRIDFFPFLTKASHPCGGWQWKIVYDIVINNVHCWHRRSLVRDAVRYSLDTFQNTFIIEVEASTMSITMLEFNVVNYFNICANSN